MTLLKLDEGLEGVDVVGVSRHSQRGWHPDWQMNGPPPMGGTQVDSFQCTNGTYANVVVVFLALPPPWFVFPVISASVGINVVTNC